KQSFVETLSLQVTSQITTATMPSINHPIRISPNAFCQCTLMIEFDDINENNYPKILELEN
ncbi:unnamed protein product, partial [Didymodactylos carnosus]